MIVDPPVGNTLVPFEYDYQLSPRAWLGWQSCNGLGFRATYFRFDESANREAVTAVAGATPVYLFVYGAGGNLSRNANANVGQTLVSNHSLKLGSLDLEATQFFRWRHSQAIWVWEFVWRMWNKQPAVKCSTLAGHLRKSSGTTLLWLRLGQPCLLS